MCVIILKPKDVNFPTENTLRDCFGHNPDGAGFAYHKQGENIVHIRKGFMTVDKLLQALVAANLTQQDSVMYHFRITTSGKTCAANTHPFPITNNINLLKAISVRCDKALAHNGILQNIPLHNKKSDTMQFVLNTLSDPIVYHNMHNAATRELIELAIGHSKIAILSSDGTFTIYNEFLWEKEKGLWYSNKHFEHIFPKYNAYTPLMNDLDYFDHACPVCHSYSTDSIDQTGNKKYYWCSKCFSEFTIDRNHNVQITYEERGYNGLE